jgi:hypothetical protein
MNEIHNQQVNPGNDDSQQSGRIRSIVIEILHYTMASAAINLFVAMFLVEPVILS